MIGLEIWIVRVRSRELRGLRILRRVMTGFVMIVALLAIRRETVPHRPAAAEPTTQSPATDVSAAASPTDDSRTYVLAAAGDIACGQRSAAACQQVQTSDLMLAMDPDAVAVLGDVQYECGQLDDFMSGFDPSWGRLKDRIYPAIGNHEYQVSKSGDGDGDVGTCPNATPGAPGYFEYFGDAGSPLEPGCRIDCKGYYSYDVGAWHVVVLNDECSRHGVQGCNFGSPQLEWLKSDLATHPTDCTLAYWHQPRFSSGHHGSFEAYVPFWQVLYANGVDVVLNGHDHDYERFLPQTPDGQVDRDFGIREFVVGTGGRNHTGLNEKTGLLPNSAVFDRTTFGVLRLDLSSAAYSWQFVPVAEPGKTPFEDAGTSACHGAPPGYALPAATPRSDRAAVATPTAEPLTAWAPTTPLLDANFDGGELEAWLKVTGLTTTPSPDDGDGSVVSSSPSGPAYARWRLDHPYAELTASLRFKIEKRAGTVYLLKFRTFDDESIVGILVNKDGELAYRNDAADLTVQSSTKVESGAWHQLAVRLRVAGDDSQIEVMLDGARVDVLSRGELFGGAATQRIQIGDNSRDLQAKFFVDDVNIKGAGAISVTASPVARLRRSWDRS